MNIKLSEIELENLIKMHRHIKHKKDADRVKSIILLSYGYNVSQVSEILLIDENTIRRNAEKYKIGGIDELLSNSYISYTGKLCDFEIETLKNELDSKIYIDAKAVCAFILAAFSVSFTDRGCRNLLHKIGANRTHINFMHYRHR